MTLTHVWGLNYTEIETPEEAGNFVEIEYTTDHKVKYYMGSTLDNNLTHNWTQFDYDHIAYYNDFYNAAEEIDIVQTIRKSNLVTLVTSLDPENTGVLEAMFELD
mgnify:CR=1 FL=1